MGHIAPGMPPRDEPSPQTQLFVGAIVPRGFLPNETRKASGVEADMPLDELRPLSKRRVRKQETSFDLLVVRR